jgi:hypothetical protein
MKKGQSDFLVMVVSYLSLILFFLIFFLFMQYEGDSKTEIISSKNSEVLGAFEIIKSLDDPMPKEIGYLVEHRSKLLKRTDVETAQRILEKYSDLYEGSYRDFLIKIYDIQEPWVVKKQTVAVVTSSIMSFSETAIILSYPPYGSETSMTVGRFTNSKPLITKGKSKSKEFKINLKEDKILNLKIWRHEY